MNFDNSLVLLYIYYYRNIVSTVSRCPVVPISYAKIPLHNYVIVRVKDVLRRDLFLEQKCKSVRQRMVTIFNLYQ